MDKLSDMKPFEVRVRLASLIDYFEERAKTAIDPENKKHWFDLYIETMRVATGFSMLAWGEPGYFEQEEKSK